RAWWDRPRGELFHHLRYDEEMFLRHWRIVEDGIGNAAVGDDVRPRLHLHRNDGRHRLDTFDIDLRQLLDKGENGIELAPQVLGLDVLDRANERTALGAGGVPFVHLEHRCDARPDDQREAGLYHTAFLMPTRGDLARWILHVARHKVALTGASDHAVSEAFYL